MSNSEEYRKSLRSRLEDERQIANDARSRGADPEPYVEIPIADTMAERCEKLLEREYGDKIIGLADQITELEESDQELSREEMSLVLAEEFAQGELSKDFDNDAERVEAAIRTAVALLTEGVVAAPIEGIGKVEIDTNDDGSKFLRVPYFGPIRSAGGTGQAVSVLVADYIRQQLDINRYNPRDDEVERYIEEIILYDEAGGGMQYCPSKEKGRIIVRNTPVMVDGTPNANAVGREVEGYRDLERIEGNHPRDGMALVMAEGIGLKAPKLKRYADAFELDSWNWLDELISTEDDETDDESDDDGQLEEPTGELTVPKRSDNIAHMQPEKKYMKDTIAGRPIFAGPSKEGAFRLRYGRARNLGLAACGFNPASMVLASEFIAPATQLKMERPGKAAGAAPVDSIEGPTVRLDTGEVRRIDDEEEARRVLGSVEKILDLGEVAVPYGEFEENNYPLAPASYNPQWWSKDLQSAGGDTTNIVHSELTIDDAIDYTQEYGVPLHPEYTYLWHDIEPGEYAALSAALQQAEKTEDGVELTRDIEPVLEQLLVPYTRNRTRDSVSVQKSHARVLNMCTTDDPVDDDVLGQVNTVAPFTVRARAPTRIGARMGRPEKSERREMHPVVHSLFPTGEAGGDQRSMTKAANATDGANESIGKNKSQSRKKRNKDDSYDGRGVIRTTAAHRVCPSCKEVRMFARCAKCDTRTQIVPICRSCGSKGGEQGDQCKRCGSEIGLANRRKVNINKAYQNARENIGERDSSFDALKGVKGLTSKEKTPEPLEKGILRAKHNVSTFRDGTARYDMCDLPLTSFKPAEIDASVERLRELGYEEDLNGEPLETDEQVVELQLQDVIVSHEAGEYLLKVADYIDDLLVQYYDMDPHYNAENPEDLIGTLIIGMAPHTSAGVLGRIIGYTDALANYAHPFYHAAKRRNCFQSDTELTVKLNGTWEQTRIDELVETYLDPGTDGYDDTYDDGTLVQAIENHPHIDELKVPSMTENGHRTVENVTHLSKHNSPDHMVTITTEDGDELTVTPDHKEIVKSDGTDIFESKKAYQVEEGDYLFDYGKDKVETVVDYTQIDILGELLDSPETHDVDVDSVMIHGMEEEQVYDRLREVIQPQYDGQFSKMKSSCEYLGITKKTLDNYMRRQSIPASLLMTLYNGDTEQLLESIPDTVELSMKSDTVTVPRMQVIDEELACLIGYYTAEGFTRQDEDTNHTDIAATEEQSREFIKQVFEKKFNKQQPHTSDERITVSGNLTRFFFKHVLEAGRLAHQKRIPDQIKTASRPVLGAYLSGYFSGDGSHTDANSAISFYTCSQELASNMESVLEDTFGYTYSLTDVDSESLHKSFPEYYPKETEKMSRKGYNFKIHVGDSAEFVSEFGIHLDRNQNFEVEYDLVRVEETSYCQSDEEFVYNLTVENTNRLQTSTADGGHLIAQCDGDEDSVMLLLDGLINFSRRYLPDQRGKNMMDAPIVMSTILNPDEIDDEAHNIDIVSEYSKEFYEKTMDSPDPGTVDIEIAEESLDDPTNFQHTLSTESIHAGPKKTAYKTAGDMDHKLQAQLDLADKTRGVSEKKVASLVIEKHFFPDIIGNLTAFARQETYCRNCSRNNSYRRVPTSGCCPTCGNDVQLTVYQGMVEKYVDTAMDVADEYDLDMYTKQRLQALSDRIESLFEDDKMSQSTLQDFGAQ